MNKKKVPKIAMASPYLTYTERQAMPFPGVVIEEQVEFVRRAKNTELDK